MLIAPPLRFAHALFDKVGLSRRTLTNAVAYCSVFNTVTSRCIAQDPDRVDTLVDTRKVEAFERERERKRERERERESERESEREKEKEEF